MEWITELAGELLSRGHVGKDGGTAYFRLYRRNSAKAVLEIGEQVMAKSLRVPKSQKKLVVLKERWMFATWAGIDAKKMNTSWSLAQGVLRSAPELFLEDQQVTGGMWMR